MDSSDFPHNHNDDACDDVTTNKDWSKWVKKESKIAFVI